VRFARGKVIDGKVVFDGEPLPEGSAVLVWVDGGAGAVVDEEGIDEFGVADEEDPTADCHLDEESQNALLEAADSIARGEYVTPEQLFAKLRKQNGR